MVVQERRCHQALFVPGRHQLAIAAWAGGAAASSRAARARPMAFRMQLNNTALYSYSDIALHCEGMYQIQCVFPIEAKDFHGPLALMQTGSAVGSNRQPAMGRPSQVPSQDAT